MLKTPLRLGALLTLTAALLAAPAANAAPKPRSPQVSLDLVAEGLTSPVTMASAKDGSGRLFVVDQAGLIRIIHPDGTLDPEPFLDVRDKLVELRPDFDERGLLGLAFHPRYAKNGRFFVYYSAPLREGAPEGFNTTSTISEFRVSADDPDQADPGSERVLLEVDKPQFNHNAGTILFGPGDGYLYIAIGDGGGAHDVGLGHVEDWYADNAGGNGQDLTQNLLGDILRIDVDRTDPGRGTAYAIPKDNPLVGKEGLDEIWAYGFRNPYRMSFDQRGRRDLFVGDAGQGRWEEVSIATKGGNFGWNVKEGAHCFDAENPTVEPAQCPSTDPEGDPLIDPVIEYPNIAQPGGGIGLVVVGGHVYRGRELPSFKGKYVFGDWSRTFESPDGTLLLATPRRGQWKVEEIAVAGRDAGRLGSYVLGFGQDLRGEMYVLTTDNTAPAGTTGKVYRLS